MQNIVQRSVPALLTQAGYIKRGTDLHGGAIGLKHTVTEISDEITVLDDARAGYEQAKTTFMTFTRTSQENFDKGRTFLMTYKDIAKRKLGGRYSEQWDATGFVGGLNMPTTYDG